MKKVVGYLKITVVFLFIAGPIVGSPSAELLHAKRQVLKTQLLSKRISDVLLKFKSGLISDGIYMLIKRSFQYE